MNTVSVRSEMRLDAETQSTNGNGAETSIGNIKKRVRCRRNKARKFEQNAELTRTRSLSTLVPGPLPSSREPGAVGSRATRYSDSELII